MRLPGERHYSYVIIRFKAAAGVPDKAIFNLDATRSRTAMLGASASSAIYACNEIEEDRSCNPGGMTAGCKRRGR